MLSVTCEPKASLYDRSLPSVKFFLNFSKLTLDSIFSSSNSSEIVTSSPKKSRLSMSSFRREINAFKKQNFSFEEIKLHDEILLNCSYHLKEITFHHIPILIIRLPPQYPDSPASYKFSPEFKSSEFLGCVQSEFEKNMTSTCQITITKLLDTFLSAFTRSLVNTCNHTICP